MFVENKLREFDIDQLKKDEINNAKKRLNDVTDNYNKAKQKLNKNLEFAKNMREKHNAEIGEYK